MRVISGTAGGIVLKTARGRWLRPTTDRARTALFDWLGGRVQGAVVLDLFCGCGALGIEALSRGAREATFVDVRREALDLVIENLTRTSFREQGRVVHQDARGFLRKAAAEGERFDVVFADPPYFRPGELAELVEQVPPVLRNGGLLILEHSARVSPPGGSSALRPIAARKVGETCFTILERMEERTLARATEGHLPGDV
ncbi:MAG: 16S rRNA (guanine(966)-N(2))-methyltransferase RsmD [candidate division KSB1 bacterium]|nr:16S rRNA (guanine(966)-N(2))-methyltransferase RsmD [candidate division KSB1 bacterium]